MSWIDTAKRNSSASFDFSKLPRAETLVRDAFAASGVPFPDGPITGGHMGSGRVAESLAAQGKDMPRITTATLLDRFRVYGSAVLADEIGAFQNPRLLADHAFPIKDIYYGLSPDHDGTPDAFRKMNHDVERVLAHFEDTVRTAVRACEVQPSRGHGG